MLHTVRNSSWLPLFCAFLALHFLNCSLDTSNLHTFGTPTDLTINHQESVVELIIEKVLGFENAITEKDDSNTENQSSLKKLNFVDFYLVPNYPLEIVHFLASLNAEQIGFNTVSQRQTYFEIHSPPPEI